MATADTPKPIHALVLDTGPIIKNEPQVSTLLSQAQTIYTIPSVIDEIRDAVTRARVETTLLPFLKLRSPKPASVKVITDFARRTGDLEVLSRPDILLMALTYELECELNGGDWRLRSIPGQKNLNGERPVNDKLLEKGEMESVQDAKPVTIVEVSVPTTNPWGVPTRLAPTPAASAPASAEGENATDIEKALEDTHISAEPQSGQFEPETTQQPEAQSEEIQSKSTQAAPEAATKIPEPVPSAEDVESPDSKEDEDGGGWITAANIQKYKEKDNGGSLTQEQLKKIGVAIMTSDFAMQNVLLRMNINLLTPSFQRIKKVKTWVLRCHACFQVTKDIGKQFCGRCGKPTLLRTSCSTNSNGTFKIYLKKNMQWNKRGDVFSIPKPVAGTSNGKLSAGGGKGGWGQSLILAEDQKEYIQAITGSRRNKEKDLMDEDYLPSLLSGDRGHAAGKPKVGGGRNVNSKKRNRK